MGTKIKERIIAAFARVADLALTLGEYPLSKHPQCWEHKIDDHWEVAVNGHQEPKRTSDGVEVSPFHCYVKFNGWPAGLMTPFGGTFAAGKLANEETFITAIDKAVAGG